MITPDTHALFVHLTNTPDALPVHFQVFQRLTVSPVSYALLGGANNGFRGFGYTDQCRPAAMVSDCSGRASHIDIETVEAEFADDMCCFIKVFRLASEYLCHDGPFRGRVEKIAEDAVATTPEPFDIGKLSQHHVGASIETMHGAAWSVSDAIHRGKGNGRLLSGIPKRSY